MTDMRNGRPGRRYDNERHEPNIQNIPLNTEEVRKIKAVLGEKLSLIDTDYATVELRILAHMGKL